jgi:hypothetical protein
LEQQSMSLAQVVPLGRHIELPQTPPEAHTPEQQSVGNAQNAPAGMQAIAVEHVPPAPHTVEQHCDPLVQLCPVARQEPTHPVITEQV